MRWGAILQCIEQEAKFKFLFFFTDTQGTKHLFLNVGTVDTYGTATDFPAIQRDIVSLGQAIARIVAQQIDMGIFRAGEWVVAGVPAFVIFVVFKHREVNDPDRCPDRAVHEVLFMTDFYTERAKCIVNDLGFVCAKEDQVPALGTRAFQNGFQGGLVQVLDDG